MSWFEATSAHSLSPDGTTVLLGEHGSGGGSGADSAVYIRNTDGSPPVRLGEGQPVALSPDGRWVATLSERTRQWSLLPTGAGEARPLDLDNIEPFVAGWYPDSRHLLLTATLPPGGKARCYSFDTQERNLRPVTPEGFVCPIPPSPSGQTLLVQNDASYLTYALGDGQTRRLTELTKEDEPLGWGADSRSLFVQRAPLPRAKVDRLDLTTGERRPFREIAIAEPAGLIGQTSGITMGLDGSYCYTQMQVQSDLYLLEGVR